MILVSLFNCQLEFLVAPVRSMGIMCITGLKKHGPPSTVAACVVEYTGAALLAWVLLCLGSHNNYHYLACTEAVNNLY